MLTSTYTLDESVASSRLLDLIFEKLQNCEIVNRRVSKVEFEFYRRNYEFDGEFSVNQIGANDHAEDIEPVEQRQSDRIRLKIESENIRPDGEVRNLSMLLSIKSEFDAKFESLWDNKGELSLTCRFDDVISDEVVRVRKDSYRLEIFRSNFRVGNISPHKIEKAIEDFRGVIGDRDCSQFS
ncbi:hypothetical protein C443_14302 [Haloarcula argentinensis DSM 12282]|nr:hypothetical protein C443_14302 [Haloarcula argentinensis DSM 12282]